MPRRTNWRSRSGAVLAGFLTGVLVVALVRVGTPGLFATSGTPAAIPSPVQPFVLSGAGDIGDCESPGDEATAALLDGLPGQIFTLGDNAYPHGTAKDFASCYAPNWGRHKSRTRPAVGSHEYDSSAGAAGYFAYFGSAAGPPGKGYYSYDLGGWHIVVLNSECAHIGGCNAGSPQERWLLADLKSHPAECTIAMWHSPLFSSGTGSVTNDMLQVWRDLYANGVELVVNGDLHGYERFAPQTPDGVQDEAHGIREIIAGTGGSHLGAFKLTANPNSEIRALTWGVLLLSLFPDRYAWAFAPIRGERFSDGGSEQCHGKPGR